VIPHVLYTLFFQYTALKLLEQQPWYVCGWDSGRVCVCACIMLTA